MMRVRVRLGAGLSRFAAAPLLSLELDDGATIAQLLDLLTAREPALEPALPSVLPVVAGVHAERATVLQDGDEVALLIPVAGGTEMATIETRTARQTVFVDTFTDGLLGPDVPMLGPVANGGHIVVNTTPGCWGPRRAAAASRCWWSGRWTPVTCSRRYVPATRPRPAPACVSKTASRSR